MSARPAAGIELADLARQAGDLLRLVRESRWAGFKAPTRQATAADPDLRVAASAGAPRRAQPPAAVLTTARGPGADPAGPGGSLAQIAQAVSACTQCPLHSTRTTTVPGEGNPEARLIFVGEAPGADEDRQGRPFVGAAGQLLDRMIQAMGLRRGDVFIANILKCRPPGNRDPRPEEVAACLPFLQAQLACIRPEIICALGKHSAQALLGNKDPIGRLRGRLFEHRGIPLLPTFHPSYLLRTPADKALAWKDLQQVMQFLGQPLPEKHPLPENQP